MTVPQILIVDDEPNVRFILENALKYEGYQLHPAGSGSEAIALLRTNPIDLMLLDLHMEPMDGLTVFNTARRQDPWLVVIILTAYGAVESAVEALRLGAFDYLFKPATPENIRQRVRAGVAQRQQQLTQQRLAAQVAGLREILTELDQGQPQLPAERFIRQPGLVIDCAHRQATLNDQLLDLTTTEFDLLVCLVRQTPKPVSPRQLVNCVLGYDPNEVEARELIKWHIHHLRQKIEPVPQQPCYIKNIRHKGYLWSNP